MYEDEVPDYDGGWMDDQPVLYGDHYDLLLPSQYLRVIQVQSVSTAVKTATVNPNLKS